MNNLNLTTLITALVGAVIGSLLTHFFTARRDKSRLMHEYIKLQIEKFYAPLFGIRQKISILSKKRNEISAEVDKRVHERSQPLLEAMRAPSQVERAGKKHEQLMKEINVDNEYNKKQLEEVLRPLYRQMEEIFVNNYWLADSDTQAFLPDLIIYNELFDRYLKKGFPLLVAGEFDAKERTLLSFYDDLAKKLDKKKVFVNSGQAGGALQPVKDWCYNTFKKL